MTSIDVFGIFYDKIPSKVSSKISHSLASMVKLGSHTLFSHALTVRLSTPSMAASSVCFNPLLFLNILRFSAKHISFILLNFTNIFGKILDRPILLVYNDENRRKENNICGKQTENLIAFRKN